MANTEGMPDEVMESLFTLSSSGGGQTNNNNSRRRRAIEERMEMSMGDRPAARVIRASPNNNVNASRVRQQQQQQQQQQQRQQRQPLNKVSPPPIMGSIVERRSTGISSHQPSNNSNSNKNNNINNNNSNNKKRQSRFAQQRLEMQQQQGNTAAATTTSSCNATGFPSVHVPLGTFVKPKQKKKNTNESSSLSTTTAIRASRATAIPLKGSSLVTTTRSSTTTTTTTTTTESLRESSCREADAMFEQMSPEERMENARELQASLSPETIEFLKKRAKAKQQQQQQQQARSGMNNKTRGGGGGGQTTTTTSSATTITDDNSLRKKEVKVDVAAVAQTNNDNLSSNTTIQHKKETMEDVTNVPASASAAPTAGEGDDSVEEKQRMADILAKIRTVGDLDATFKAEMGDYSPLQSSEISPEVAEKAKEDPFPLACTLLRSTVPRQNLWAAQIVSKRLREQWEQQQQQSENYLFCSLVPADKKKNGTSSKQQQPPWPYPVMLPASLRCLLDSPISHTNGYVLHTYVLQAMYSLLRLRACMDHVVDVEMGFSSSSSSSKAAATTTTTTTQQQQALYQEYFLEDAIPTPPVGTVYETIANVEAVVAGTSSSGRPAAAYRTSSSSKSAQQDGEAFAKDPMWTLLSQMCMIPRLAQLMRIAHHQTRTTTTGPDKELIPKEAIVAICGILAMMSQRSPGAATAIVHHQTLLRHLIEVSLMPSDNNSHHQQQPYDPLVAVPTIRLLCVLARQSRTAAERIPFDEFIPPILTINATSIQYSQLQKWSIILWRTLLRYSLGLPTIPTMITIATSHMALGGGGGCNPDPASTSHYSLTTEFASSFAIILQSLQVARRHLARVEGTKDECVISRDQFDALSQADLWLSSSAQQAISQLEKADTSNNNLRFHAGQMHFLSAFIRTSREEVRLSNLSKGEFKDTESCLSDSWIGSCQQVLAGYVKDGLLEEAFRQVSPGAFVLAFDDLSFHETDSLHLEASACAFLCSFASLQVYLIAKIMNREEGTPEVDARSAKESLCLVVNQVTKYVDEYTRESATKLSKQSNAKSSNSFSIARRGWLNRACFAIIELHNAAKDAGILHSSSEVMKDTFRKLQFALIGRLERGDEALAVVLFSEDSSFIARASTALQSGGRETRSLLSSVFFREMCRTSTGRVQLDHSFKLRHGPGITPEEVGAFGLRSLLSDVDLPGQSDGSDILLPIGILWLWQVLSSPSISQAKENVIPEENARDTEAVQILCCCLNLILELEQNESRDEGSGLKYVSHIPAGAKAYHLMNICLQPETILQNNMVTGPAASLLDVYCDKMDESFGLEFAKACALHSDSGKKTQPKDSKDGEEASKTEKFAAKLLEGHDADGWESMDKKEMKAVVDFIGEACEAYIEYGAQYDFFTRCVRILSHPSFPPRVRSQAMRRLAEVLHRISLPGEDDFTSEDTLQHLMRHLTNSIAGSLPSIDGSARDPPDFLDAIAAIYKEGGGHQACFGYSYLFGLLVHVRHLSICSQPESLGFEAAKKRLLSLNHKFSFTVVDATRHFLESSDHSKAQLIRSTIQAAVDSEKNEDVTSQGISSEMIDALKLQRGAE